MENPPSASIHRLPRARRAGLAGACLALGATALGALAYFESVPVWAKARLDARAPEPQVRADPFTPTPARVATTPAPAAGTRPTLTASVFASSRSAGAPASAPRATLIVPDFKGKRLSQARREGRKLGLVLSARDDDGERVPAGADIARYYRVRRQLTAAGTTVESGAPIELRVREIDEPAMGY